MQNFARLLNCLSDRVSEDGTLAVWVNMEDHLRLVSSRADANIQEAFTTVCLGVLKVRLIKNSLVLFHHANKPGTLVMPN